MKFIKLILPLAFASSAFAGGYKIPEQSSDSMALVASNIAKSFGADAAYYNPANMVFLDANSHININTFYIHLGKTKFNNYSKKPGTTDTKSKDYNVVGATTYYVSPFFANNFRFGLSFNIPAGLAMEWDDNYPASVAERFDLKIYELAPSLAYQIFDNFSVAAGVRVVYTDGVIKNRVDIPRFYKMSREVEGDSFDFGYNLALTYKPTKNLSLAATYRSKVDINVKGDTNLNESFLGRNMSKTIATNISIPLPASLNLALAYEIEKLTFMFAFERTYWSSFKELDFNYDEPILNPITKKIIDDAHEKKWKDSNTYRFGVAYQASDKLRLMGGFGIDENIAADKFTSFELPNTKAYIYSVGANYAINSDLEIGFGYLYQDRQKRNANVKKSNFIGNVEGEFDPGDAQLVSLSLKYKF